jgi:hypothetical protein
MGTCALTEFKVEVADAENFRSLRRLRKFGLPVKLEKATADYANPERPLEPNFDDRSKRRRVTGPVTYAIDGKDETAWGIDAGPGGATCRATRYSPPRKTSRSRGARS